MAEIVDAFQCVGCGRIDAPRACIGVCQDRALKIVAAGDYYAERNRADAAAREAALLRAELRLFARVRPAEGRCAETLAALQARAEAALSTACGRGGEAPGGEPRDQPPVDDAE